MTINIGFLNKNNAPASPELLNTMKQAYSDFPIDKYSHITDGPFALGHMNIDILTENPIEAQPLVSASGRYIGAGRIRIDNREDLIESLSLKDVTDVTKLSDTRLFMAAYEKWKNNSFDRLVGDFAMIIWDTHEKDITIARDVEGNYPLFWYETSDTFYFSSTIKAFFQLPCFCKEINTEKLVEILCFLPLDGNKEETVYKNICGFKDFHFYRINRSGIVKSQRYWTPEHLTPIVYQNTQDYYDHFLSIYNDAVLKRLSKNGYTGSYLSSGLDSTSVTALAHRFLSDKSKTMYSYSSVPRYPEKCVPPNGKYHDESPYINIFLRKYPQIKHTFINSSDFYPLDSIDLDLNMNGMFTTNLRNGFWYLNIMKESFSDNVNVLLTGQSGNITVSRSGSELFEYILLKHEISSLSKYLRKAASSSNTNVVIELLRAVLSLIKTNMIYHLPSLNRNARGMLNLNPFSSQTLSDHTIQKKLSSHLFKQKNIRYSCKQLNTSINRTILNIHIKDKVSNLNMDFNLKNLSELRDPTADRRLKEYTKQIPPHVFNSGDSNRNLIKDAMKNLIPDEIRLNQKRGIQAYDIALRLQNKLDEINTLLESDKHKRITNFNKNNINKALESIQNNPGTRYASLYSSRIILPAIATIKFIDCVSIEN